MPNHLINGMSLEFETRGPEGAPAFLLIRGLSTQLVQWPECFLETFVSAGFRVIVFDNRDCGLSEKFDASGNPTFSDILSGAAEPAYGVADMAADAVGLLDHLGIPIAHVAGISLGGMIVQHLAFSHGDRFKTVASIMSTSGARDLPQGTPEAMEALTSQPEDPNDRESVIAHNTKTQRVIASPDYSATDKELRRYFEQSYDRCYCPAGSARQMAAVVSDGSRVDRLKTIRLPFLVLHGSADPLIPLACGEDTARHVPGAKFEVIKGMGHDITIANAPVVAKHLIDHAHAHAG